MVFISGVWKRILIVKIIPKQTVMKLKNYFLLILSSLCFHASYSQDLEPRSLSSIPTSGNFIVASYGSSQGNILVDNTLPIEDLESSINSAIFGYARSFKFLNKLSKFDAITSYSFGSFEGVVSSVDSSTSRNGFGDPMLRFSMILVGDEVVSPSEFAGREKKKFKLGISFRVKVPLGQYSPDKLLNLGMNRWAFKAGVSASYSFWQKLIVEGGINSWFFTKNKDFYGGNEIYQKPLLSFQLHTTYLINPNLWAAVSLGRSTLGETVLNNVGNNDSQNNSRMGVAIAYRLDKSNSIKFALTSGVTTRYGADYTSILVVYQFMWFDK